MKALIVDDSNINIKVACKLLEKINVEVDFAINGMECLEKVKTNKYNVIFMDIMMPEMDGVETFAELKKIPNFDIPVVALTADAGTGAKEKYLSLGFYEYISKPIDFSLLQSTINKIKNN